MVRREFWGCRRPYALLRRVTALVAGGVWWWALLRLLTQQEPPGTADGLVLAGGWGLSLLPVHCAPWQRRAAGEGWGGCLRKLGASLFRLNRPRARRGPGPADRQGTST